MYMDIVFLMQGFIFLQCCRKYKDFDPIYFEYSMFLNCKIEQEQFPRYIQELLILLRCKTVLSIYLSR